MAHAFGVPSNYLDKTSVWYGWGDIIQNRDLMKELSAIQRNPPPPQQTDAGRLAAALNDKSLLGNALDLTSAMYDWQASGNRMPDFNLDGDRGYGFLCWAQRGDPAPDTPNPIASEAVGGPFPVDIDIIR